MVAISPPPSNHKWASLSFVSTLYLGPILDLLLQEVPKSWCSEVRLGLQEALVNAAKHGNRLDPSKKVVVRYATSGSYHWWVIADQGPGFHHPQCYEEACHTGEDPCSQECGRGLFILYQIFDDVWWKQGGRELYLCKQLHRRGRLPLIR